MIRKPWMLAALALMLPAAVFANPQDHDGGFFLRLSTGLAGGSSKISDGSDELKASGVGADFNIAIGGVVSPNLALHGTLFGFAVADPEIDVNGTNIGEANGSLNISAIGGGLTYYFMPVNLYFSASVGFSSWTLDFANWPDYEPDMGFAIDGSIGKEWWVGGNWGLGVAGGITYHNNSEPGVGESWTGPSLGVRFSATRN